MVNNDQSKQQNSGGVKSPSSVNSQTTKVKKGKQISIKKFLIGCVFFGLLLVLLIAFGLYKAIQSPSSFESLGLKPEDVKNLLMMFTVLFFGVMFFISFSVLLLNGYRRFTSKGTATTKFKYGIGTFLGFILLLFSVGGGAISIIRVNKMGGVQRINASGIISPFFVTKDSPLGTYMPFDGANKPIIAPAYFRFKLNKDNFNKRLASKISGSFDSLELDCGNGQTISAGGDILSNNSYFKERCFYREKKKYNLTLIYNYVSENGNNSMQEKINIGSLDIDAKVDINGGNYELNDSRTSIVLGNAPATLKVDASDVFVDLELGGKNIKWDFDFKSESNGNLVGNPDFEKENVPVTERRYDEQDLYKLLVEIPSLGTTYYLGNISVLQRNVPHCDLNINQRSTSKYLFQPSFSKDVDIKSYNFSVINNTTKDVIDSETKNVSAFVYNFEKAGKYTVKMNFVTKDDRKGFCESELIDVSSGNYKISYEAFTKGPSDSDFEKTNLSGNKLIIQKLPSKVRVSVNKIVPNRSDLDLSFLDENGREISPIKDRVYQFGIEENKDLEYTFKIQDDNGNEVNKKFSIEVEEQELIAELLVEPDVGESPLTVNLDASISELKNPEDEILYFTWDFGDGDRLVDVSQGKVNHTYHFDKDEENGVFYPKVKIETKKGLEDIAKGKVSVKREQRKVKLVLTSHPTQIARKGDTVNVSLNTSGKVKNVEWDFGNGKTISGEGRRYIDVSTVYDEAGNYTIKSVVTFEDYPSITSTVKLKVK